MAFLGCAVSGWLTSAALRPFEKINAAASAIRHPMDLAKLLCDLKELLSNRLASDVSTEACTSFDGWWKYGERVL